MDRSQGRRTGESTGAAIAGTGGGNRGLQLEEPLLFECESGDRMRCGVDLPEPAPVADRLGGLRRDGDVGLPALSEPQVVRHFTRLSQKNYSIDGGLFPLGSCTMKHNPRLNEKMARLPGFADIHPLQPEKTVQGALQLMDLLAHWLKTLCGMPAIALSPAAGAHGELCGMMTIRAALEDKGDGRKRVLIPESAHGTNPATAAACGYDVVSVPDDGHGRTSARSVIKRIDGDVAAVMLTNPNTAGLFEAEIMEIAAAVHEAGAFLYCDGANFNAIVGRLRPADLGIDCMHINLHKTFSTPHGGGGPGSGPVVLSEALAPFAPLPWVVHREGGLHLLEHADEGTPTARALGRLKAFHGQMGMFVRALSYMMSHGGDGLRQVSGDAVLNANYVLASLKEDLSAPFPGPCMHEALFDDRFLRGTGITTLDFAKALIDEGYHPMTMYFPLIVPGALLIEPTETESRDSLDRFIATLRRLSQKAQAGDVAYFQGAPRFTPRRRLDETAAARKPVLRWRPPAAAAE